MLCPSCATPNPAQARFCMGCGRLLVNGIICPTCHTLLPPEARYCFHCGAVVILPLGEEGRLLTVDQRPLTESRPSPIAPRSSAIAPPSPSPLAHPPSPLAPPSLLHPAPTTLPAPRPIAELLPTLRRYLPNDKFEPLERRPTHDHLEAVSSHLSGLLSTAKTYLPWPVVIAPQPAGEPAGGMYRGAFLFGDMSGFTPLSEKLKPLGQVGAERIAEIINSIFTMLVAVLLDHGGVLLKFGGDALLGVFPAESDAEMAEAALRAVQASLVMQAGMEQFSAVEAAGEKRALKLKIGVNCGEFFAAHLGTRPNPEVGQNGTMSFVTTGHTVNRTEICQGHAEPGGVAITQETLDLLGGKVETAKIELDPADAHGEEAVTIYRVISAPPVEGSIHKLALPEPPEGDILARITYLVERIERLAPYLSDELLARIVTSGGKARIPPDHRPVTVMFANYLGISELIARMGHSNPELIIQHLNDYFVHMAEVVEHYEGTLARMDQYAIGDRLVIFFGAPRAHEDDPERAVRTALAMQEAMRKNFRALQTPQGIFRFQQRIGINTGKLFAGNCGGADRPDLRQEYTLMGDDINMAARLMSKAEWGAISISAQTQVRVEAFFELQDLGEMAVKGKTVPVHVYRVKGERRVVGQTRGVGFTTPLIGRDTPLQALKTAAEAVKSGNGRVAAIVGDSGLGKSRLLREFRASQDGGLHWMESHAHSFSEQVSYWLAAQMVRNALDLQPDATEDDILFELWEQGKTLLGEDTAREAIPFLANMLSLELEGDWATWVRELDPKARQKQTFWAAGEFFAAKARQSQGLVVAVDDLHFADEASLALLESLLEVTIKAPLLFCLVFRPVRDKGCWRLRNTAANKYPHRFVEAALQPLTSEEARELLGKLLPGAVFSRKTLDEIIEKANGNPFYLEEVARSLKAGGAVVENEAQPGTFTVTAEIENIKVPDTLHGAIIARIDRLTDDARLALQMASVIGRRFQLEILHGLAAADEALGDRLAQLERGDLIRPEDADTEHPIEAAYQFPDALVHEIAYDNLLVQRRQEFHRQVGLTLENILLTKGGEALLKAECQILAHHFRNSDDAERARKYLEWAGDRAKTEFANETAIRDYTDLLALLGEKEDIWQKRYAVLDRRQQVYGLVGNAAARKTDLDAMLALADAHKDTARRACALNGLADLFQWSGKYDEARAAAEEACNIAASLGDQSGQATALHTLGVLDYYRGNYPQARPVLEQAVALRQTVKDAEGEAWSAMYLGMIEIMTGNYGEALKQHAHAYEVARARQDNFQAGIHLTNLARVYQNLGEYELALDSYKKSLEMKTRTGDRVGQGFNLYGIGLVHACLGDYDEAETSLQLSLKLRREVNDERGVSYCLHGMGLVALGRGQDDKAEEQFQQAYDARLKLGLKAETIESLSFLGAARLKQGNLDGAKEASDQALDLLAKQGNVPEPQQLYLNHYRILAARGDSAAGDYLAKAKSAMLAQSDRIADPGKRQIFLEKVKVNREVEGTKAR